MRDAADLKGFAPLASLSEQEYAELVGASEERSYAARVLRDLSLRIDGRRVTPQLVSTRFPTIGEMKEGLGGIRIAFQAGNATNASVPNPFYNLLPANLMPGQLRTTANVPVSQLLTPYPQYGPIWEGLIGGRGESEQPEATPIAGPLLRAQRRNCSALTAPASSRTFGSPSRPRAPIT